MFRKDKKLFITLILMFIIVASLIVISYFYENQNREYENVIAAKDKSLNSISTSYNSLEEENEALQKRIDELEEEKNRIMTDGSDFVTYRQSLILLADISLMIKQGNISGAKEELLKIDTNGYDQTALAFYESLCRELDITK